MLTFYNERGVSDKSAAVGTGLAMCRGSLYKDVMHSLTKIIHLLALGLWFGSAVFFTFIVALTLLHTFTSPRCQSSCLAVSAGRLRQGARHPPLRCRCQSHFLVVLLAARRVWTAGGIHGLDLVLARTAERRSQGPHSCLAARPGHSFRRLAGVKKGRRTARPPLRIERGHCRQCSNRLRYLAQLQLTLEFCHTHFRDHSDVPGGVLAEQESGISDLNPCSWPTGRVHDMACGPRSRRLKPADVRRLKPAATNSRFPESNCGSLQTVSCTRTEVTWAKLIDCAELHGFGGFHEVDSLA